MRTIKQEISLYKFKELSEEIQEEVLEMERQYQTEFWEGGFTIDCWQSILAEMGFKDAEISFSGFWSQGDGASFTADVDLELYSSNQIYCRCDTYEEAKAWALLSRCSSDILEVAVLRDSNHYSHEHTCSVHLVEQDYSIMDKAVRHNKHCLQLIEELIPSAAGNKIVENGVRFIQKALRHYMKPITKNNLEKAVELLEADLETDRLHLCRKIYQDLQKDYEYLTSEEHLLELFEEVEFTSTGERYD